VSADEHHSALHGYEEAVTKLYGERPLGVRLASVGEVTPGPMQDEELVQAVLKASEALTASTAKLLDAEDPLVCESGEARLAALAAKDIAVAFDVAQLDADEHQSIAHADLSGPVLPEIEREVASVLAGDPADGVPSSPSQWAGRAQLAGADVEPRKALRAALPGAVEQVRDDATEVVIAGIAGLVEVPVDKAIEKLAGGLLQQLPNSARKWYAWALSLLKEGIKKLKSLFGKAFDKAVQSVWEWLKQHAPKVLADRVYGVPRLRDELAALVDGATSDKDWAKVGKDVQAVVDKHATIKKIVLAVFKALEFARKWILRVLTGLAGEAVVGGVFVLGAAYGLFAGGDYVDWHRTDDEGAFDFVRGVRRTATAELE
jgi:hypothetical protein